MSHQYNLHMDIEALKSKLLWQMTGEEFLFLQQNGVEQSERQPYIVAPPKKHVYGIRGIAELFGCIPTANRIKASGKIDQAITQIGRKIIVDADLAFELAGRKTGGRKVRSRDIL